MDFNPCDKKKKKNKYTVLGVLNQLSGYDMFSHPGMKKFVNVTGTFHLSLSNILEVSRDYIFLYT